jgi:methylmalonyl-CoA mutase N-terminal domain/subunit
LSFFLSAHNDLLEEVAKFRAARRMWARIMKDRFGAKRPESLRLRFHTQTAGSTLTARQPESNVVRVTVQALAAVLGGTQSLHTCSLDEALALPSDAAARTAVRTQQIILEESGIAETIDPLGGSYAIEALTNDVEAEAAALIERVDRMGGMVRAIEEGFPQREIEEASYAYQKSIERGERTIVGVNDYTDDGETPVDAFALDPEIERRQVVGLRKMRAGRDGGAVEKALAALDRAAAAGANLFPPVLEAVKTSATLGEICAVLAGRFGRYRDRRPGG